MCWTNDNVTTCFAHLQTFACLRRPSATGQKVHYRRTKLSGEEKAGPKFSAFPGLYGRPSWIRVVGRFNGPLVPTILYKRQPFQSTRMLSSRTWLPVVVKDAVYPVLAQGRFHGLELLPHGPDCRRETAAAPIRAASTSTRRQTPHAWRSSSWVSPLTMDPLYGVFSSRPISSSRRKASRTAMPLVPSSSAKSRMRSQRPASSSRSRSVDEWLRGPGSPPAN